jgi:hypothetical protein
MQPYRLRDKKKQNCRERYRMVEASNDVTHCKYTTYAVWHAKVSRKIKQYRVAWDVAGTPAAYAFAFTLQPFAFCLVAFALWLVAIGLWLLVPGANTITCKGCGPAHGR